MVRPTAPVQNGGSIGRAGGDSYATAKRTRQGVAVAAFSGLRPGRSG